MEDTEGLGESEEERSEVFTFYEQHFATISSYAVEELNGWIQDLSEELVLR